MIRTLERRGEWALLEIVDDDTFATTWGVAEGPEDGDKFGVEHSDEQSARAHFEAVAPAKESEE